jgi:hypothetical protein
MEKELIKYHELCAKATLYPGKTIEEIKKILNKKWNNHN